MRVYVGGVDVENVEQVFHPPLSSGACGAGSQWTSVGRRIVVESASDLFELEEQARRSFSDSPAFEIVQSLELADYVMVMEADSISAGAFILGDLRISALMNRRIGDALRLFAAAAASLERF